MISTATPTRAPNKATTPNILPVRWRRPNLALKRFDRKEVSEGSVVIRNAPYIEKRYDR